MYQFFIQPDSIKEEEIWIADPQDVNHIRNVLRMKKGEKVSLCCEAKGKEYICSIEEIESDIVKAAIIDINGESRELPVKITLFQGLPKSDKMELIIQKAVELGVAEIVPMATKRAVVKLDAKKAAKKVQRWNEIAKSAAKQSKRGLIPEVKPVMSFKEAVEYGKSMDMLLIPYEDAKGIAHSREVVETVKDKKSLGIYIGTGRWFSGRRGFSCDESRSRTGYTWAPHFADGNGRNDITFYINVYVRRRLIWCR